MKQRTLVLLAISVLSMQITFAQSLTQESQKSRKGLAMRYYFRPEGCHPVEVIEITNGSHRPEVWTSMITIKSLSAKPVKAIKVRWDIYQWDIGQNKDRARRRKKTVGASLRGRPLTALENRAVH